MIVWLASYPRSGNTFLRIVLNRLYGIRTSVIYDIDGVAQRLGSDLIGFEGRPATIEAMRASHAAYFIKTHRQRGNEVDEADKAVCLVRDGRDSLVSWARLNSEHDDKQFTAELRRMIDRHDEVGTGSWGQNVLSWLQPSSAHRVVLRYEELLQDPCGCVEQVTTRLLPELRPLRRASIPSFAELQQIDDRFFRRGRTGTHRDELPDEWHDLFWSWPDNRRAMALLGYEKEVMVPR